MQMFGIADRETTYKNGESMKVLLLIIIAIIAYAIMIYNKLVKNKVKVDEGWSGISVQLKRRHDLVPNLVKTVKGYAEHEKDLLVEVTEARKQSVNVNGIEDIQKAEKALSSSLSRLLAVAENYPELKANENFLKLQDELTSIENSLQHARRYYNGAVREYQITQQTFPSNLIADYFKFENKQYFELEDAKKESAVPEVNF